MKKIPAEVGDWVRAGMSDKEIAAKVGVSRGSVRSWRSRNGLSDPSRKGTPYSDAERALVLTPGADINALSVALGRSNVALRILKSKLSPGPKRHRPRWTIEEDALLLSHLESRDRKWLSGTLGRSRQAVNHRLHLLRRKK